jgi:hypothetical protein
MSHDCAYQHAGHLAPGSIGRVSAAYVVSVLPLEHKTLRWCNRSHSLLPGVPCRSI